MKELAVTDFGSSTMCRLCLSSGVTLLDLFSFSISFKDRLANAIMSIAPVQIRNGDGMPNFICEKCHTRLEDTHQFQIQIVQSVKTLQRYLEQLHDFDKKSKLVSSIQRPAENPLIDDTNAGITEKCESSEPKNVFDLNVNWGEKGCENLNADSNINDEISLKSKIKDQLIDDYSLNPAQCTDHTIETLSKGGEKSCIIDIDDNKMAEDININWKVEEPSYFNSTCKSIKEMSLKYEIKDEPMDDSLIVTESVVDTNDFSEEVSEIGCEDTKVGFGHTWENAACLRSSNVGDYFEKFEEGIDNTSINPEKHKKVTKVTSHQSEKTLQRYLEQLHAFDTNPKLKSSIQRLSEDPLIDNNVITEKCESSEPKGVFDLNVNCGEKGCENFYATSKISDEMSLKSKIKDELIDDYSLNPADCTDHTVESLGKVGEVSHIVDIDYNKVEDININWKVEEPSYFNSTCRSIEEMFLKSEIKDEMDDSLFLTESVDDTNDFSKEVSEISCEDTKVGFGHTSGNAACLRSSNVGDYFEKFEEGIDNTSINPEKHKKVTKLTSHQFKVKDSCSSRGCKKGSSKSRFLKSRKRARTSEISYQCGVCNKCFTRSSTLNKHKLIHTGEKPYQCDVCNKSFTRLDHLNVHKLTHTGEKPCQCDFCKKCFTTVSNLNAHKKIHTGEKPYQCDVCNKFFSQSSNLSRHRLAHTGEKPYRCDICNKCFTNLSNFNSHGLIHTGEQPYQCDVCNKCFTYSNSLNYHRLTHTGEKPYQCDVCKKCFTQLAHLKTHKLLHTGVKPYQCDVCNRSFTQSSHLKRHNLLHTHEKPYQCDVCNKCFTMSSNLNTHKLTHTVFL